VKILHVDTEKGWRGGQQQLLYLLRGLREKGVECAVACRVNSETFSRFSEEGFRVIPLKGNQTSDLFRLGAVAKEFDLVHAHAAKAHTVSALSKKFHKRPVVYTRRVDYPPKRNRLTELKYRLTDRVAAVVGAVRGVLKERFPDLKVEVIYSAVDLREVESSFDPEKARKIRRELGGEPLIGTLAALTEQKDIPNFIEAAQIVLRELPRAKFVVFGEGKLREELQRLIERKGLKEKFILYGFVKEPALYAGALDIFVLPSKNEGIGGANLIAMALKVPVVATDVGGVGEVVIDGQTGILVPPSNPKALAEAVLRLARDGKLKKRVAEKAYQLVKEKFTVEPMVNSYLNLYGEVLSEWRRSGAPLKRV